MKLSYGIILLFAILLIGCDNTIDFDNGPCKFAPPESNFPIISSCEECFFNLNFQDKEYSFPGNKIASNVSGDYSQMNNVFLSFYLVPPNSDEELNNSIDIKTPLLKVEAITKLNDSPPLVSVAFGIYNYCNDFFEPITDDVSQSFHQLTKVELVESYPTEINFEPFQLFDFYLTGELQTTFIINGETQMVTAQYKVKSIIYEKL
jgi:hypothetical protein